MSIKKKSLQHVSSLLFAFDTFKVYKSISETLKLNNVSQDISDAVLSAYSKEMHTQFTEKIKEAQDWLNIIIKEIED